MACRGDAPRPPLPLRRRAGRPPPARRRAAPKSAPRRRIRCLLPRARTAVRCARGAPRPAGRSFPANRYYERHRRAAVPGENYAGSIIVSLASLPDFLRKPILSRRLGEFFGMAEDEKAEIVSNALLAGPGIPFSSFARLFKTWLEVMASLPAGQRAEMFGRYAAEAARRPDALAAFHIDGMLAVFDSLGDAERGAIARDAAAAAAGLDAAMRRRIRLVVPDKAAKILGV